MKLIHSAGIITYTIHNDTILYLLLHYTAGHWDFPKGKIEPEETKQQAALRELTEETGLTAELDENFAIAISYTFLDYDQELAEKIAYFFIGKATSATVILSDEHTDFAWLTHQQAQQQLTYDNAKMILQKADNYLTTQLKK